MARGNWRNWWEGNRNGAEAHGARHSSDYGNMKVSGKFETKPEAQSLAIRLRRDGFRCIITKGRKYWTVWRSFHRVKSTHTGMYHKGIKI